MAERTTIADWEFNAGSNELRRGSEVVRLEHRTARALALLCSRAGETVAQADITKALWGERHISANSVPVVIRDLRRALGDDAREPRFIETVAKSGYRLIAPVTHTASVVAATPAAAPPVAVAVAPSRWPNMAVLAGVIALLVVGVVVAALSWPTAPTRTTVLIGTIPNQTGSQRYDVLADAVLGLIVSNLSTDPGLRLISTSANTEDSGVRLNAKLVLWDNEPDVVFSAIDLRTGEILWSSYAFGPEHELPQKVSEKLDAFTQAVAKYEKRAR